METSWYTNYMSYWKWSPTLSETIHPTTEKKKKKKTWWFIEKNTFPAYRVQLKQIFGPQDRCALPHCKLQAKILQPPAKQLDSCNHNIQIWGWIQLIQRKCGENQNQNVFFSGVNCEEWCENIKKHTTGEICLSPTWKTSLGNHLLREDKSLTLLEDGICFSSHHLGY